MQNIHYLKLLPWVHGSIDHVEMKYRGLESRWVLYCTYVQWARSTYELSYISFTTLAQYLVSTLSFYLFAAYWHCILVTKIIFKHSRIKANSLNALARQFSFNAAPIYSITGFGGRFVIFMLDKTFLRILYSCLEPQIHIQERNRRCKIRASHQGWGLWCG